MFEFALRYPASMIAGSNRLCPADIVLLRRYMFPHGLTSADDAQQLLALHRSPVEKCPEWDNWFVEVMTAFIVVHSYPQGSLDEINASWLIGMVSSEGVIATPAELELVLHVMEMAIHVPDVLSAFALDQLNIALKWRRGAYADARACKRAGIAREDIDFIYRILRGSLSFGKMVLSALELGVLDEIEETVAHQPNHPAWRDLVRSTALRTPDGHASASPWLRLIFDDIGLGEAA